MTELRIPLRDAPAPLTACDAADGSSLFGRCGARAAFRLAVHGEGCTAPLEELIACPDHRLLAQRELAGRLRPGDRLTVHRL